MTTIHGELLTYWAEREESDGSITIYPAVEDAILGSGSAWRIRDTTRQPQPPADPNATIVEFWAEPAALQSMIDAGAYPLWTEVLL